MSKYLAALKGRNFEESPNSELSKLPKGPYDSFGSAEVTSPQKYPSATESAASSEAPHYRWLVVLPDGSAFEVCALPELTGAQVRALYPGKRVQSLPDSPWEAEADSPQLTAMNPL